MVETIIHSSFNSIAIYFELIQNMNVSLTIASSNFTEQASVSVKSKESQAAIIAIDNVVFQQRSISPLVLNLTLDCLITANILISNTKFIDLKRNILTVIVNSSSGSIIPTNVTVLKFTTYFSDLVILVSSVSLFIFVMV